MDTETIIVALFGGIILGSIIKALTRKKHPDFLAAVRSFTCDPTWREKTFHNELRAHLERALSGGPLRKIITEAGLTGTTTRLDLHALYGDTDYLITVKKDLSSQKVMTLIGEVNDVLHHWRPSRDRKTSLIVLVYGVSRTGGDDHVVKLVELVKKVAAQNPTVDVRLEFTAPGGTRTTGRRAA